MKQTLLVLMAAAALVNSAPVDPIDAALARVGLTRATARIKADEMNFYGGDAYRLHFFDVFMDDPFRVPDYLPVFTRSYLASASSVNNLVVAGGLRVKAGVRRGLIASPLEHYGRLIAGPDWLANAVRFVYQSGGMTLPAADYRSIADRCRVLPDSVQRALALVVATSVEVLKWRNLALAGIPSRDLPALYDQALRYIVGLDADTTAFDTARLVEGVIGTVDYEYLNTGATDLALVLDTVRTSLAAPNVVLPAPVAIATPLGRIVIGTAGADRYEAAPYLLIYDPGGDDLYEGGAATFSPDNPVSIIIDAGGNDRYIARAPDRPSFGAAILGYAFLYDLGGNDLYQSENVAQGAGVFGVGVLYDAAGDDTLHARTACQGAGYFGIGVCANVTGDDYYTCYQQGQGFGYTRGCGLLVDRSGNDVYIANDTDIAFPSAQSKEHNTSLAQGAGFGKRADFTDGHSLAGGVGMLVDGSGDDRYSCGVFGQGCGYWYGVGILADREGNDTYDGVWYVQGACAHFAVGILYEGGGDDRYHATMNMAQGAGHDFSLGWLLDESGNDVYDAPNLSLGGGNANGIGIFWDRQGDDAYQVTAATTLGRANIGARGGIRGFMLCLGLFLDTGHGRDRYAKPFARNNTTWVQAGENTAEPLATEKGVGRDE